MIIGVPKEIKANENRVALLPVGAQTLKAHGHSVIVEKGAGVGSGFSDESYRKVGSEIVETPKEVYSRAEMIMKVKEPLDSEYGLIRKGQVVFAYFHFASSRELTEAMMKSKCVAIAYETVQRADRSLPLLIPMSEVAGRMAPQEGAKYLERTMGGRGVLLAGVPGTEPADVAIIGGGVVGMNAAKIASGLGARVTILDNNLYQLRYLDDVMPKNVVTMMPVILPNEEMAKSPPEILPASPGSQTTTSHSPLRPFFIVTGATMASSAPWESSRPTTAARN